MKQKGISVNSEKATAHIKVYEDNAGAIEIAKEKKYRPRTKHLNCRLHHFRHRVEVTREISVQKKYKTPTSRYAYQAITRRRLRASSQSGDGVVK